MAALAREQEILFHSDMTQVFGKLPIDLSNLDYMSFSAHKAYALKGCGGLWVRRGAPFEPLVRGGSQERYRRSGTENILSIASLEIALDALSTYGGYTGPLLKPLRDYFETQIKRSISGVSITHENAERLPNTSHLILEGVDGESLLMNLDLMGYAVSTGAACSSGSSEPSPVLLNLGFSYQQAQMSLRVSFGISNTKEEIDQFLIDLSQVVNHLRNIQGASCEF
jgi:cysteine desulfurase